MAIEVLSESPEATGRLGELCGQRLWGGILVLLTGELGAGKTVFAKGMGRGLGVKEEITSPSFNLMLRYNGRIGFDHWDLYRLDVLGDDEEFLESAYDTASVTAVEWGERILMRPDVPTLFVGLQLVEGEENKRNVVLDSSNDVMAKVVEPSLREWESR